MQMGTASNMQQSYQFIDLSYLELMADNDKDMKLVMLEMLLDELPEELQKMQTEFQQKNWEMLGATSHKMKSTLAFVGNASMVSANKDIENYCQEGVKEDIIQENLSVLNSILPNVLKEVEIEIDKMS